MRLKVNELERTIKKALATKYDKEDVDLMTPVIMFGELSGKKSHGIVRIQSSILNREPEGKPTFNRKSTNSILINSKSNPGMLAGANACNEIVKLVKEKEIGIVGTHGSQGSSGCLSYYVEKIANEGLVALIFARPAGDVAPYGGLERIFGTNPIAFGIPMKEKPLIFDMATSAISYGAVIVAKNKNKKNT